MPQAALGRIAQLSLPRPGFTLERVWTAQGKLLETLDAGHESVTSAAFAADGLQLLATRGGPDSLKAFSHGT